MEPLLDSISSIYSHLLTPIPATEPLGLPTTPLDILGVLRAAIVVHQVQYRLQKQQEASSGEKSASSFSTNAVNTIWSIFVVVNGGDLIVSSFLSRAPGSFLSFKSPLLIITAYVAVASLFPRFLPLKPTLTIELPLSVIYAFTRGWLWCTVGPMAVLGNASSDVRDSAWALYLTNVILALGGFFIANSFSMLSPTGWAITTPPELKPAGWTSLDVLAGPIVTTLFSLFVQPQSTWVSIASLLPTSFKISSMNDSERARAFCTLVLLVLFSGRVSRSFGILPTLNRVTPVKRKSQ